MFFEVPQYIDIEDKIAFQLTAKQLGWFALGGVLIFLAWNFFEKGFFVFSSIVIIGVTSAMALFRPYGLSMASFIASGFIYLFRPKIYVWRKEAGSLSGVAGLAENKERKQIEGEKKYAKKNIHVDKIAKILDDTQGF